MPYKNKLDIQAYNEAYSLVRYQLFREKELDRVKQRQFRIKQWFLNYRKQLKCSKCESQEKLEFHHLDPHQKEHNVSDMAYKGFSIKKILKEIEKCIILCKKCHAEITY